MNNPVRTLDLETRSAIIHALAEKLRQLYIFPAAAESICGNLQRHADSGDYANIEECDLFALALTMHLQEVNHDEHLWVKWHPDPLPDDDAALHLNPEWQAQQRHAAEMENFGFHRAEKLPGNIGFLDIRRFVRTAWGSSHALAALRRLVGCDALIVDLRSCTGGHLDMITLVLSHFFGETPAHLASVYWRDEDRIEEFWTRPALVRSRFSDRELYVLTSRNTFSGGEVFAAILQSRRRAVVMGEKTDGGAHPGASYRLHPHFEVFIPIGRVFDPATDADLEGVGVTPDILMPQDHACLAAYHLALIKTREKIMRTSNKNREDRLEKIDQLLKEQTLKHLFCPACGYQNPPCLARCKNCDQILSSVDNPISSS